MDDSSDLKRPLRFWAALLLSVLAWFSIIFGLVFLVVSPTDSKPQPAKKNAPKPGLTVIENLGVINDICFAGDGRLLPAFQNGSLRVWDQKSQRTSEYESMNDEPIHSIAIPKMKSNVVYLARTAGIEDWRLDPPAFLRSHPMSLKEIQNMRTDAMGGSAIIVQKGGRCSLWSIGIDSWSLVANLPEARTWGEFPDDISSDGSLVAFGDRENLRIRIWDCKKKREVQSIKCIASSLFVWDFAFLGSSHEIAGAGAKYVGVWDADTGVRRLQIGISDAWAVASTASGRTLVISDGNSISVVDAKTGSILDRISTERAGVIRLAISANEEWIAALHVHTTESPPRDSEVSLWRLNRGDPLATDF